LSAILLTPVWGVAKILRLQAHAKLNLGLRVLGLRPDGFHELHTHMHTIDLADELRFERSAGGTVLETSPELDVSDEDNLVTRAIRLFRRKTKIDQGIRCLLSKHIPPGTGLGGGSSDAAATLVALNQLFKTGLSQATLTRWAAQLGADVPFFIKGGYACAKGSGQRLTPLDSPFLAHHFVLLVPPLAAATPEVYGAWDALGKKPCDAACHALSFHNDLEVAACRRYPALVPCANLIQDADTDLKGMSGSGSAFYAGFARQEVAEPFAQTLRQRVPDAQVLLARAIKIPSRYRFISPRPESQSPPD